MEIKYNDKLRKDQVSAINGYYHSQHPKIIAHKTVKSIVEPETPKLGTQVHLHDVMTHKEVAELLRISELTLKRWGKAGKIKCIRINPKGDRRYLREEIKRFIEGNI